MHLKTIDIGRVEPNLLNREFNCNAPNQKWVTDITYLKYDNGRKRMYLSVIEDLYNREIIAYKISDSLDISFVEQTLGEAFKKVNTSEFNNLIIHSDQGSIINQISINLHLRNMELNKVCQEKGIVMIMHALKISLDI